MMRALSLCACPGFFIVVALVLVQTPEYVDAQCSKDVLNSGTTCMYNQHKCGKDTCTQAALSRAAAFMYLLGDGLYNTDEAACGNFKRDPSELLGMGGKTEITRSYTFTYNSKACEVSKTVNCKTSGNEASCTFNLKGVEGDKSCSEGVDTCLGGSATASTHAKRSAYMYLLGPGIFNTGEASCSSFKDITGTKLHKQLSKNTITRTYRFHYSSKTCKVTKTASCTVKNKTASCTYKLEGLKGDDDETCKAGVGVCIRG